MSKEWTNEAAIRQWESVPRAALEASAVDGDFAKRHLVNPVLLRMLGEVAGRRVLDAGSGDGYLSRMLAARGARVVGVEPAASMLGFAREKEADLRQGVRYVRADLARLPDLGGPFDAVVCSMVLMAVPDWRSAMRGCVASLRPGGLFVFAIVHPAFEGLWRSWRAHGEYRTRRYLAEYEVEQTYASDFHRPVSAYLNELAALGCRLRELAEPGLDPGLAARAEAESPGISGYVDLPNFLIAAAEAPA
ncbi:class I SAM-dependent methyltransferase [Allonocardiopsis opalescens]|uniref:Methyltransferase family protein n=1 Tax=Allonocardiopsis opalescens TaxID=1144618 RepID=A0A2T0Q534_9ACTN|nr:class I SAM-dependent methyltransferase [Allonocardiopsis opalescens]PRX98821.1 methyltransferase family protein [Allonocardiopsis opalescens]